MRLFKNTMRNQHPTLTSVCKIIVFFTLGSLSVAAMDNPLMSLFKGGGGADEEEAISIHKILTTDLPKKQKTFAMDSEEAHKIYLRGEGENKSILIFSLKTIVHPKNSQADASLPDLKLYENKNLIISYLKRYFEKTYLSSDILEIHATRAEYHARRLQESDQEMGEMGNAPQKNFLKRCRSWGYTLEEIEKMEASKKRLINLDFDKNEALYNILHTKDIDISIVFSYFNRSREFIVSLKTDSTKEIVDKVSPFAERVHDYSDEFFDHIGKWMELNLDERMKHFVKEAGKKTGTHS